MIIAFESKKSQVLDEFLHNYENPKSMSAQISKGSFLEFKIKRFDDLIIISQKHLFDVVAKWIFMCAFIDLLFAYSLGLRALFYIGGIFAFTSLFWLSKYARFYALKYNLWRKGHKEKVVYVNDVETVEKLLLRIE
jgi:hypothetical protein